MKILLFGGSGLLGTAIQRLWKQCIFVSPDESDLDLSDENVVNQFIDTNKPDWIVNCAAYNNVDMAEGKDHDLAFHVNSEIPESLARIAYINKIPFIHFSTDYVFDGTKKEGYTEEDESSPISVYGKSKYQGEQNVLRVNSNSYVIRTSRLYGQKPSNPNAKRSFPEIIFDDAKKATQILVNNSEVSSPTFVDDLAQHLFKQIIEEKPPSGIYHMTNSGGATWFEWAQEIGSDLHLPVMFVPSDPTSLKRLAQRPMFSMLRSTKISPMRSWQESLKEFLQLQNWKFEPFWIPTGINGTTIEPQPRIGEQDAAVLHMIPGGTKNPYGFGTDILDLYASTAHGKHLFRGGHYHPKLDELFFVASGTSLWILSDFRQGSPTYGKTVGIVIGIDRDDSLIPSGVSSFFLSDGSFSRLRVPHGVYHTYCPLTDERVVVIGVGSTSYDKDDYQYPTLEEIPDIKNILKEFEISV